MNKLITIVSVFVLSVLVNQKSTCQFLPADWRQGIYFNGNVFNSPPPQPRSIKYIGDTILCGINYSIICQVGPSGMNCASNVYIRKQAGQIYMGGNCGFPDQLIYDFSLNVNDTVSLHVTSCYNGNFRVDNTYNFTLLNGSTRKYMALIGTGVNSQYDTLRWIEDIGDINRGFLPECDFEGGHTNFICHKENGQTIWSNVQNSGIVDCDSITAFLITGIDNPINEQSEVILYPNPINEILNVTINSNELSEITLFDIYARKLFQQTFINSLSINTEQLLKGIYLYEVRNKNGLSKKGRVIKD